MGLLFVWVLTLLSGFGYLMSYANTPGELFPSPVRWPESANIHRIEQRPTLVMFIHPDCPCTRASVEELSRVVARCQGRADVHVVVLLPCELPSGWEKTDLYRQAAAIPGVTMHIDHGGMEACRFHATTSGHTVLYDAAGHLVFQGGITLARGHSGDNAGESAVVNWLVTGRAGPPDAPVFGCALFSDEADCRKGRLACRN